MRSGLILVSLFRTEHVLAAGFDHLAVIADIDISRRSHRSCRLEVIAGRSINVERIRELVKQAETIGQRIVMDMRLFVFGGYDFVFRISLLVSPVVTVITQT